VHWDRSEWSGTDVQSYDVGGVSLPPNQSEKFLRSSFVHSFIYSFPNNANYATTIAHLKFRSEHRHTCLIRLGGNPLGNRLTVRSANKPRGARAVRASRGQNQMLNHEAPTHLRFAFRNDPSNPIVSVPLAQFSPLPT